MDFSPWPHSAGVGSCSKTSDLERADAEVVVTKLVQEFPDEKVIQVVLPEGWRVSVLAADSGLTLQTTHTPPLLPPYRPQVCGMHVTTKRIEPAPTFTPAPAA